MKSLYKSLFVATALLAVGAFAAPPRYFGQTEHGYQPAIAYGNNADAGHYVQSGDARIYYEVYGAGKPLVVLHGGLVGSPAEMGQFIDEYSRRYQVIAISTRGHGKSDIGTRAPDYAVKADDVRHVLDALQAKPAILLGFSDGGYTAYHVAAQYPDKVEKIIAIGAGEWRKGFREFGGTFADFAKLDSAYWKEQQSIRPEPQRTEAWYEENMRYFNELEIGADLFKRISAPVLVLAGEDDANAPLDTIIAAYRALLNADLAIIADAPHPVFQKNFPAVRAAIDPFLDKAP